MQGFSVFSSRWASRLGALVLILVMLAATTASQSAYATPPKVRTSQSSFSLTMSGSGHEIKTLTVGNSGGQELQYTIGIETLNAGAIVLELANHSGIQVPNASSLNFTNAITIMAWVNPSTWQDGWMNNGRILQKGFGDNQYRLTVEDGSLLFDLYGVGRLTVNGWVPPLNTWTHVAATYDGARMRIYVNGSIKAQRSASGKIRTSSDPLYIGNKDDRLTDSFIGQLDEVYLYNTALGTARVRQMMWTRALEPQSGLVGYWQFENMGSGGHTAVDTSAAKNHGQLLGTGSNRGIKGPIGFFWVTSGDGSIGPGSKESWKLYFTNRHLPSGATEDTALIIRSNDPNQPSLRIPIKLIH